MQTMLIRNAVKGSTMLLNLGPTIKIANIPAIEIRPWVVFMQNLPVATQVLQVVPQLLAHYCHFQNHTLNAITIKKQNATTKYTLKL